MYLVPNADGANQSGVWTGVGSATKWENVDSGILGGTPDDATYNFADSGTADNITSYNFPTGNLPFRPQTLGGTIRARWRKSATSGKTLEVRFLLLQSGSNASVNEQYLSFNTATFGNFETPITAAITNYANLTSYHRAVWTGGGAARQFQISESELELRDGIRKPVNINTAVHRASRW